MSTLRDIRRRIKSVKNTQQITKAMKMVSAAKLRRAQEQLFAARPYAEKTQDVLARLAGRVDTSLHPLLAKREVKRTGVIIVTADRGLAGGYNANIIRQASAFMKDFDREQLAIIAVGRKGRDYFRRRQYDIVGDFIGLGEEISFAKSRLIAHTVTEFFLNDMLDEVYLIYPKFINTVTQRPTTVRLLPLEAPEEDKRQGGEATYLFEPSPEAVLDNLLPRYINTLVYRALLEAKASEHGARMAAMDAATKNADEMIKRLTLRFNRARQASITREISEIVAGAEALK